MVVVGVGVEVVVISNGGIEMNPLPLNTENARGYGLKKGNK